MTPLMYASLYDPLSNLHNFFFTRFTGMKSIAEFAACLLSPFGVVLDWSGGGIRGLGPVLDWSGGGIRGLAPVLDWSGGGIRGLAPVFAYKAALFVVSSTLIFIEAPARYGVC